MGFHEEEDPPFPPWSPDAPREPPVLIIDTDVGGDPDDAFALVIAAWQPGLSLVLTTDEHDGQRARFARQLLDACGRSDVPVVAGRPLPGHSHWVVADLIHPQTPSYPGDPAAAVEQVVQAAPAAEPVRWVGLGAMANLARIVRTRPELMARLEVTQMGGAFRYRHPDRAEHNFRRDLAATHSVLAAVERPWLVTSDVAHTRELELTPDDVIVKRLAATDAPWARLLVAHLDRWVRSSGHPGSIQHDPLTLSAALRLPFVDHDLDRVALDDVGRLQLHHDGIEVYYSHNVDYAAVRRWLAAKLDPTSTNAQIGNHT